MSPSTRMELEKDFEKFLNFCEKEKLTSKDLRQICKPLLSSWRRMIWKRIGITIAGLILIWWMCNNMEVLNWFLSAVGRLFLIELLPFWNWTPFYNAKCLVNRNIEVSNAGPENLGKYETEKVNCVMCEKFELLPSLTNVTYSMIEHMFLERGLPVIIHDSHPTESLENIIKLMFEDQNEFLNSDPCNIETNLVLKKFFAVGSVLEKIAESSTNNAWFVQLRNCQFEAVKASRRFIRRTYYYPLHFEPFYSSWVLMSNNYEGTEMDVYLQGLIFVQQLSGKIFLRLMPKSPCDKICLEIEFILMAGEGLVFSTDLWILSYRHVGGLKTVTTIMEIDWHN